MMMFISFLLINTVADGYYGYKQSGYDLNKKDFFDCLSFHLEKNLGIIFFNYLIFNIS
jgi:hypothetical protein